jgi:hypothetical protein
MRHAEARCVARIEDAGPLRSFEVNVDIAREAAEEPMYPSLSMRLRMSSGERGPDTPDALGALSSMIEQLRIYSREDCVGRSWSGAHLSMLSYLDASPEPCMKADERGLVRATLELPAITTSTRDARLALRFRDDVDAEVALELLEVGLSRAPQARDVRAGSARSMCIVTNGAVTISMRDLGKLLAVVWRSQQCRLADLSFALKDVQRGLCHTDGRGWVGYDLGERGCVVVCALPCRDIDSELELRIVNTSLRTLSGIEMHWIVVSAPDDESCWVDLASPGMSSALDLSLMPIPRSHVVGGLQTTLEWIRWLYAMS